eukprot:10312337-Alexandrium_andersonii.AAC.1
MGRRGEAQDRALEIEWRLAAAEELLTDKAELQGELRYAPPDGRAGPALERTDGCDEVADGGAKPQDVSNGQRRQTGSGQ